MKKLISVVVLFLLLGCNGETNNITKLPIKIIIFADKTGSLVENNIPKLEKIHLKEILEYIEIYGGELALCNITNMSKENLSIIRKIPKPALTQGETADEFNQRIREWKKNNVGFNIDDFLKKPEVSKSLNYSSLYGSSNISDGIDLANIYLKSKDFFGENVRKIAIFITDGENNVVGNLPASFCCEMYMVTRSSDLGILNSFKPSVHPRIEECISEILYK